MSDNIILDILSCLNISTLQRLKNKCESYITYCIDYKQVNAKYSVKTKQKDYLELLEQVNNAIAIKQLENDKITNSASSGESNITSCMEKESQQESKKKEKKAK